MQYLCLMYVDRGLTPPADAPAQYAALRQAMSQAGVFLASGQLHATGESTVVRIEADGTASVVDGPLSIGGPAPGAFYLIECADRDDAVAWAKRIPAVTYGSVEVRPLRAVPSPSSATGAQR